MTIMILLIFIMFPVLGLPIFVFFYYYDKNKKGILYSTLIGISLGIIAYYFVPNTGYDLVRHQNIIYKLQGKNIVEFFSSIKKIDLEFIPVLYTYIISFFKNPDLLQFFIVSLGYSIIAYILYDYRKKSKANIITFLPASFFVFFGFQHLYFISGLYCYIAIILFCLTLYNEYIKEKNKKKCMVGYILTLFIHNSMFLPFIILLTYKFQKEKFTIKSIATIVILFFSSFLLINELNLILNNSITNSLVHMYGSYTSRDTHFKSFYSGTLFFIEISKLVIIIISILTDKKNEDKKLNGYIVMLSFMVILMMLKTRVAIRYIMIIQIIGIVPLIKSIQSSEKKFRFIFYIIITVLSLFYMYYYYTIFSNRSFGNLNNSITKNIISIFNKN